MKKLITLINIKVLADHIISSIPMHEMHDSVAFI